MTENNDLLNIFWDEVGEHLSTLNAALLEVEMAEGDERRDLLREMNRLSHSMKGAARAVGYGLIETISHYMEEVFNAVLENRLALTPDVADSLYDGLDLIQNVMHSQDNANPDGVDAADIDDDVVATVLTHLEAIVTAQATPPAPTTPYNPKTDSTEIPAILVQDDAPDDVPIAVSAPTPADDTRPPTEPPPPDTPQVPPAARITTTYEFGEVTPTVLMRTTEESIRVSVSKLDYLMAEASELFVSKMQSDVRQQRLDDLRRELARWQREWRSVRATYIRLVRRMQHEADQLSDPDIVQDMRVLFKFLETNQRYLADANRNLAQVDQIIRQDNLHFSTLAEQLQDDVANLRMMPFESIVSGFNRMVRDLAHDLDKQVHFDITGTAVEIDKTVLDALKDPLMHLLRNAIDHGLESPAQRVAAGKSPVGRINLTVEQRGSEIIIHVMDDGRGLNLASIRRKAVERGLFNDAEVNALSDDDVKMLIFQNGFSTSPDVTAVSGRGLGMDIVRTRVENLRGRVEIHSTQNAGTTITITVPVSLTRLRCIVLRVGDATYSEVYAVPSVMVARMETLPRSVVYTAEGRDMVTLNDKPVMVASLSALLGTPRTAVDDGLLRVIALRGADRIVAFEVDQLESELELVLKPLGRELANAPFVAGASLLGTGEVLLVLDANELVRHASGSLMPKRRQSAPIMPHSNEKPAGRLRVLVVDDSITTRTLEKNILETSGFEVHVAIDGAEAWARLAELAVDVVISDVEMPNMNGLDLTRRIKSSPQTQHLPVILLTSLNKPEQREAGLRAGADAYLVKSRFDQGELLTTIYAVI